MVGYDEQNTILLPPRVPGSQLPKQLLEHYALSSMSQHNGNNVLAATSTDEDTGIINQPTNLTESFSGSVAAMQDGVFNETHVVDAKNSNVENDKGTTGSLYH